MSPENDRSSSSSMLGPTSHIGCPSGAYVNSVTNIVLPCWFVFMPQPDSDGTHQSAV